MGDQLLLKWGTIKGWEFSKKKDVDLLNKWVEGGVSVSCAMQDDTPEQKQAICDLIRQFDGSIINDWSGESYTKEQAIEYVMNYGI